MNISKPLLERSRKEASNSAGSFFVSLFSMELCCVTSSIIDLQNRIHRQWMRLAETFPTVVSDPSKPSRFVSKLICYAYFWCA